MTRFAFATWDGGGNVPPAVGIAQVLASRGHHVEFIGYEVQRRGFEERGFSFSALRRSGHFDIYGGADPAQRLPGLIRHVWACDEHPEDIRDAVEGTTADVVVIDFSMNGALAAATQLTIPTAVLAHSTIAGLVPPPESPMGSARLTATNQVRERIGLPALSRLNDGWLGYLTLVATIPELDPAAAGAGAEVHYVGPLSERVPDQTWDSPWDHDDDRPLVVVSFSTTGLWDQTGRLRNTLDALAGEPVRVLASAPQGWQVETVPANASVRGFVPHALVLPRAAVTVTHAGHGTVTASLAHGVPLLALPNPAADQPFLAATLERLGAGLALDGGSGPDAIRTAVRALLNQPSFASAARSLGARIRAMPGAPGAAELLESLAAGRSQR
jgi:MGT family glycosyltransferase